MIPAYFFSLEGEEPPEEKPEATLPDIPWECHNTKPVDPEKAWAAVVAMSRGN